MPLSVAETTEWVRSLVDEFDDAACLVLETPDFKVGQWELQRGLLRLREHAAAARRHIVVTVHEHHYRGSTCPHFAALMLDREAWIALWANSSDANVTPAVSKAVDFVCRGKEVRWQEYERQQGDDYTCGLWMMDNIRRWLAGKPLYRTRIPGDNYAYIQRVQKELVPE